MAPQQQTAFVAVLKRSQSVGKQLTLSDFLDTAYPHQTLREAMHDWVHYVKTGEIR